MAAPAIESSKLLLLKLLSNELLSCCKALPWDQTSIASAQPISKTQAPLPSQSDCPYTDSATFDICTMYDWRTVIH